MKKVKNKKAKNLNDLVKVVLDSFQSNQKYMDGRFDKIDQNFNTVKKKIDNISLNIVDVVRKEDFDKLEQRVTDVEEAVDLKTR